MPNPLPTIGADTDSWGTKLNAHLTKATYGPVINVRDYDAVGDGTTDDRAAIQAAINAVSQYGGVVYFPRGIYKINASGGVGLDVSGKYCIQLVGETGLVFNDGGEYGTQLKAGQSNMTLVKCDGGASVQHQGPTFRHLGFYSDVATVKLLTMKMVNHWELKSCNVHAEAVAGCVGIEIDVDTATYPGGDNAYGYMEHCAFVFDHADATAVNVLESFGFLMLNCNFAMLEDSRGVKLLKAQDIHMLGNKFNYAVGDGGGYMLYCEGGNNWFTNNTFECPDSAGTPSDYAVQFVHPGTTHLPYQGWRNKFIGNQFASNGGTKCVIVGADCDQTVVAFTTYGYVHTTVTNNGSETTLIDQGKVILPAEASATLGFFGAAGATKQTGVAVSAAGIHAALVAYGLISA